MSERVPPDEFHHLLTVTIPFTYITVFTVFHTVQLRITDTTWPLLHVRFATVTRSSLVAHAIVYTRSVSMYVGAYLVCV